MADPLDSKNINRFVADALETTLEGVDPEEYTSLMVEFGQYTPQDKKDFDKNLPIVQGKLKERGEIASDISDLKKANKDIEEYAALAEEFGVAEEKKILGLLLNKVVTVEIITSNKFYIH